MSGETFSYKVTEEDLRELFEGLNILEESGLVEKEVIENVRFVVFDSENLYIATQGEHRSTEKFEVSKLSPPVPSNFNLFKIPHSGFIGTKREDYFMGKPWFLAPEIEETALNAKKFYNEHYYYSSEIPEPEKILDTIALPPKTVFDELHHNSFDYLIDLIFHEAGHIEYRRARDWKKGEKSPFSLPEGEGKEKLKKLLLESKIFPSWFSKLLLDNLTWDGLDEAYAMLIDREASKRYRKEVYEKAQEETKEFLAKLQRETEKPWFFWEKKESLKQKLHELPHLIGMIIATVLEEQFEDFQERKKALREVLGIK